ncbi:hypothetical protein PR202_ga16252 [Eleusine coracana subsp. coracana]|uniref:Tesmin/TSO1-like CXC domain-containing protein n=1 Tax=Eleusine coracana subsp. coracana TaxID=191504 RepID=A0AAV5CL45_ELECO|nr:hypothetical protein PR202_ga16252 [Eleusine coracana subsp. coracana]
MEQEKQQGMDPRAPMLPLAAAVESTAPPQPQQHPKLAVSVQPVPRPWPVSFTPMKPMVEVKSGTPTKRKKHSGVYCDGCNCKHCGNTVENEKTRQEAINNTKQRNPNAFQPKIENISNNVSVQKDDAGAPSLPKHNKGCRFSPVRKKRPKEDPPVQRVNGEENMMQARFQEANYVDASHVASSTGQECIDNLQKKPRMVYRSPLANTIQFSDTNDLATHLVIVCTKASEGFMTIADSKVEKKVDRETGTNTIVNFGANEEEVQKASELDNVTISDQQNTGELGSHCSNAQENHRPASPATQALMCDEQDLTFGIDCRTSIPLVLPDQDISELHIAQENAVLREFRNYLRRIITRGQVNAGVYCDGCNCKHCGNTVENEKTRQEAINNTKQRNPNAFQPKIENISNNVSVQKANYVDASHVASSTGQECIDNLQKKPRMVYRSPLANTIQFSDTNDLATHLVIVCTKASEGFMTIADSKVEKKVDRETGTNTIVNFGANEEEVQKANELDNVTISDQRNTGELGSHCSNAQENHRPASPATQALMCDEQDLTFGIDCRTSIPLVLPDQDISELHISQENAVLREFRNYLRRIITRGQVNGEEFTKILLLE